MKTAKVPTVDAYLGSHPAPVSKNLEKLRSIIKKNAPGAEEIISYGIPAYKFHGMLVYFAAYPHHIGFYPTPSGIRAFEKELATYPTAKASVQFPHGKPLPWTLIAQIVKFRVLENLEKAQGKKKKSAAEKK